jgi:hypothetical protein
MKALHNLTLIVQKALNARHLAKLQSLEQEKPVLPEKLHQAEVCLVLH